MAFYKAVLNGSYFGQDVKNILWYRTSALSIATDILANGEQKLAEEIRDKIWLTPALWTEGGQDMRQNMLVDYRLDSIDVTGYNDDFGLVTSDPYVLTVDDSGQISGGSNGPATCVIMRANTMPVIGPGAFLPKRGYLAFGPLSDESVGGSQQLTEAAFDDWAEFGERLGTTLLSGLAGAWTFIPVRVRVIAEVGVISLITYKDVINFAPRSTTSFRRSRMPEA